MGYFCCKLHVTRLMNLIHHLVLYPWSLVPTKQSRKHAIIEEGDHRPSPSLVPVPLAITSHVLVKKTLRVIGFGEFLDKIQTRSSQDECEGESHKCAICLNRVEREQEIRELSNCRHVYHRECLEGWLEQGHQTCPLCRLKVLPAPLLHDLDVNHDPWRSERMVYLFGKDDLF